MTDLDGIEALDDQAEALGDSLGNAAGMAASFDSELRRVNAAFAATGAGIAGLERGMSKGLRRAFDGVIFDGMKLSDALNTVAQSMIQTTYSAAMKPVTDHVGGLLASGVGSLVNAALPFANGGAFAGGRVTPFASGGVVSSPVGFPMRGGMGLMGEAGPEAIMPLARGPDGKLGVRGGGGGTVNVVMNIQTPDAQSFQRSQGQIAAQMSRALSRGNRNR
ncbi:phage tail tape measure protein [Marinibacterium sp. SX1]|uniref:phage tail tape measure protein n=1 Tax=Marinibacterium sp. SX1 TaxID=3388424 RepID=UPI003D1681AE